MAPHPLPPGIREEDVISLNPQDVPVVRTREVVRPQDDDPSVETPGRMWIIPSTPNSSYLPSAASDLMIRQEYYNLLVAILWSLYRQSQGAQLKRDFPTIPSGFQ